MEKTFGELAEQLMFSDEELNRISSLLEDTSSLASKVMKSEFKGIPKKYLNRIVKKNRILHGFPVGKPRFFDKLYEVCKSTIANKEHSFHLESLKIYRMAVVTHLNSNMANLNKLLLTESFGENNLNTNLYFVALIERAEQYNVELQDIANFYELWGFPRDQQVEDYFQNNLQQQSEIKQEESNIPGDSKKLEEAIGKVEKLSRSIEAQAKKTSDNCKENKKAIAIVSSSLDVLTKTVDKIDLKVKSEDDNVFSHIKSKQSQFSKDIKTLSNHTKSLLKNQRLDKKNEERLTKIEKVIQVIQDEHKALNERIGIFKNDLQALISFKQNLRTSGSLKVLPKKKYVSEAQFIRRWYGQIEANSHMNISLDQAVIYHSIFKNSLVTIVDDGSLFESWLSALGWLPGNKIIAANPIWTREEDWAEGVEHLQGGTIVNFFPTLTIHNYNCGIPEVSFFPTLLRLSKQRQSVRIALVSRDTDSEEVRAEMLTLAPYISAPDIRKGLSNDIGSSLEYKSQKSSVNEIIPGENFYDWFGEGHASKKDEATKTILTIAEGMGISLPVDLIELFGAIHVSLVEYFKDSDSVELAGRHTIFPWIKTEMGEGMLRTFAENLSTSIGREVELT